MKKTIYILIILAACNIHALSTVKITGLDNQNPVLAGYTDISIQKIQNAVQQLGILQVKTEFSENEKPDIFMNISLYISDNNYNATAEIKSTDLNLAAANKKIHVKSVLLENISLLIAREIVKLHDSLPLIIGLTETDTEDYYIAAAGTSTPEYDTYIASSFSSEIKSTTPFSTLIYSAKKLSLKPAVIKHNAHVRELLADINSQIEHNIYKNYRMNRTAPEIYTEHKFIEGLLFTNPLGNVLAPGIGSYFSMKNLGIENPDYSYINICGTFAATFFQVLYVPYKNNFKFDYETSDKSSYSKEYRYFQTYLLSAIPFTFSVSYLDFLALNCQSGKMLPPFFIQRNEAAASLSFFIPGGGYFYKGRRALGLLFYSMEFSYGAYYFSHYNETSKDARYLYGFLALRLIDVAGAYFINSNYSFFNNQINEKTTVKLYLSMDFNGPSSNSYYTGLSLNF